MDAFERVGGIPSHSFDRTYHLPTYESSAMIHLKKKRKEKKCISNIVMGCRFF